MQNGELPSDHLVGLQAQNLYLANYLSKLEFVYQRSVISRKREAKQRRRKLAKIIKACHIPADDVSRYLRQDPGTLDSMVEVGLDHEVRSGLGVEPVQVPSGFSKKKRSLMFSYQDQGVVLEREVADEALAILKQKEEQTKSGEPLTESQINAHEKQMRTEMDELDKKSKVESKVLAKAQAGKKDDNREVNDLL